MKNHMYNQEYGKLNYLLPTLMIIGPRKCLILSTFGANFQLSIAPAPPKKSLTRCPLMGLKNYDISLFLKKMSKKSLMSIPLFAIFVIRKHSSLQK